jgi:hypothetical protein
MEPKKTHIERKTPQISLARLADYMAASEQAKRSIATSCKYRPIARVIQYNEAKAIISNYIRNENRKIEDLKQKLEAMKARIFENDFDADVNEHNCDCISRFIANHDKFSFPYVYARPAKSVKFLLNEMPVSVQFDVISSRVNMRNKLKLGSIMLRYAKGKNLSEDTGTHQSAFMCEFLRKHPSEEMGEAERDMCLTVDVRSGEAYRAPSNSTYLFKEMAATCSALVERWPAIKPPPGAVL